MYVGEPRHQAQNLRGILSSGHPYSHTGKEILSLNIHNWPEQRHAAGLNENPQELPWYVGISGSTNESVIQFLHQNEIKNITYCLLCNIQKKTWHDVNSNLDWNLPAGRQKACAKIMVDLAVWIQWALGVLEPHYWSMWTTHCAWKQDIQEPKADRVADQNAPVRSFFGNLHQNYNKVTRK